MNLGVPIETLNYLITFRQILESSINVIIGLYLVVQALFRYFSLRYIAASAQSFISPVLKVRINLMVAQILLVVVSLVLIVRDTSKGEFIFSARHNGLFIPYCSSFIILFIAYAIQIHLLYFEYKKGVPQLWYIHKVVWFLSAMINTIYLISSVAFAFGIARENFTVVDYCLILVPESLRWVVSIALVFYCIRHGQDISSFDVDDSFYHAINVGTTPSAHKDAFRSFKHAEIAPHLVKNVRSSFTWGEKEEAMEVKIKILSKLSTRFNATKNEDEICYQTRITLSAGNISYDIAKSIDEFLDLQSRLEADYGTGSFPPEAKPPALASDFAPRMQPSEMMVRAAEITQFLMDLLRIFEFYPNHVLSFLEIPEPIKTTMLREKARTSFVSTSRPSNARSSHEPFEILSPDETSFTQRDESQLCPYFQVAITRTRKNTQEDTTEFFVKVNLAERPEEDEWTLIKTYKDFQRLDDLLRKKLKMNPPALPRKTLMEDPSYRLRAYQALEDYLRTLLNDRFFFRDGIVFSFIGLNRTYLDLLNKMQVETDLSGHSAKVINHKIVIKDEKRPFTLYILQIETPSVAGRAGNRYMIHRRYKEFENLHKGLKFRFGKNGKPLPELPPKFNIFGKTPIQQREMGLERYMNELFNYQNIGDSFLFRKFINNDPRVGTVSFRDNDKEEANSYKGESLDIIQTAIGKRRDDISNGGSQN